MNRFSAALALNVVLVLNAALVVGCTHEAPETLDQEVATMKTSESVTGRYRFVLNEARREAIYAELAKKFSGAELEEAKREVNEEAEASVVEFTEDSRFRSLIGETVLIDAACEIKSLGDGRFYVTSADKKLQVRLEEGDLLVMEDPEKGELTFERVR